MSRASPQLNIRSEVARDRADLLARQTGRTRAQVVEDALLAYTPPSVSDSDRPRLVQQGRLLVMVGGPRITREQVQASIDEDRDARGEIDPDAR